MLFFWQLKMSAGNGTNLSSSLLLCGGTQLCLHGSCVGSICSCTSGWSLSDCSASYPQSNQVFYAVTRFGLSIGFAFVAFYSCGKLVNSARHKRNRGVNSVTPKTLNGIGLSTYNHRGWRWVDANVVALFLCVVSSCLFVAYTVDPFSLEFTSNAVRVVSALFGTLSFEFAYAVLVRVFIRVHARFDRSTRRFLVPLDCAIIGFLAAAVVAMTLMAGGALSLSWFVIGCDIIVASFAFLLLGSLSIHAVTTLGSLVPLLCLFLCSAYSFALLIPLLCLCNKSRSFLICCWFLI